MIELLKTGITLKHAFFTGIRQHGYAYNRAILAKDFNVRFTCENSPLTYMIQFKSYDEINKFIRRNVLDDNFFSIITSAIENNQDVKYNDSKVIKIGNSCLIVESKAYIPLITATRNKDKFTGLDDTIDDFIDMWHGSSSDYQFTLPEYLGMTKEEYHRFVQNK